MSSYNKEELNKLLKNGTGESVYLSNELSDLREIGRHYELMGALIRTEYIDFELIYEIIPFPDDFWIETEEFRKIIRTKNWFNGKGLPDFWKNFGYLEELYKKKRAEDRKIAIKN